MDRIYSVRVLIARFQDIFEDGFTSLEESELKHLLFGCEKQWICKDTCQGHSEIKNIKRNNEKGEE